MSGLLGQINPGLLLVLVGFAGCLIPVQRVRQALMVATPVCGHAAADSGGARFGLVDCVRAGHAAYPLQS